MTLRGVQNQFIIVQPSEIEISKNVGHKSIQLKILAPSD